MFWSKGSCEARQHTPFLLCHLAAVLLSMLLSLLLCAGIVSGFRPNHESGEISSSDFTDTDITELGVLRAVAWYMERNPLPGKPALTPGELENMNPLNATGLFKAYYKADVSPSRFIKAIKEIVTGNNLVESSKGNNDYYFYCEQISKSINQIRILVDSMLSSLKGEVDTRALEAAHLSAGRALHVVQKFYSNTNWVEMGKSSPYEYLCKCGHGGKYDLTQTFPATGGINKETSNPKLSPHYRLHQKAAELAIEATKSFFVGDGRSKGSLYGLKPSVTLSPLKFIFVFTDAGPKDESLKGEVEILIESTKSTVNYLLTGYCARRKRRRLLSGAAEPKR
ncbi:Protein G7c, partial [Ophiophagus hannah]